MEEDKKQEQIKDEIGKAQDRAELDKKIEELQKQADEYLNGWKRARADYENLQNQIQKEKNQFIHSCSQEFVNSFLPVLDNIEHAMTHHPDMEGLTHDERKKISQWIAGINNIYKQFLDILRNYNVKRLEPGKKFDHETMEAVETKNEPGHKDDEILQVISPAYELDGKVIRPAKVIVNKKDG